MSKRSAQIFALVSASISGTLTRARLPHRRTVPPRHIADNLTAAGNSAALSDFTGKPTGKANTYNSVMVDEGNNTDVSIVEGRSGTAGA